MSLLDQILYTACIVLFLLALLQPHILSIASFFETTPYESPPSYVTDVVKKSRLKHVILRRQHLDRRMTGGRTVLGCAFTVLWFRIVVLDTWMSRMAPPGVLMFVVAHELGHHANGDCDRRVRPFGLGYETKIAQLMREVDADNYAMRMTGVTRDVLKTYLR